MSNQKHYKAFISYSHDNEEFGAWLHKQLEKYKIPKRLREDYPHLPKTLYPIFRDRYELNSGDDLGIEISKALENSDALIVVCSTKSASSMWVNREIVEFKMKHGEERIFPIIVDGVPFAKESDRYDDSLEYFPEALKYKVDSEGNLTHERTEKLASDFNKSEEGEELAKLKLIAGFLGVPFGEFYRRDELTGWWGNWERELTPNDNGDLFIFDVQKNGFYFNLDVNYGANIANIENVFAKFKSDNEAIFQENCNEGFCEISFIKINDMLFLKEKECISYKGMGCSFEGEYNFKANSISDDFNDVLLSEIYNLLGDKYWEDFKKCFHIIDYIEVDSFNKRGLHGFIKGLRGINEAIIITEEDSKVWGAFLDRDILYYFTSEIKDKKTLPIIINDWQKTFQDKEIIFLDGVQ